MPIARARLAGQARAKKCTAATLSRIGRQGGKAAAKALTPEQRREKASRAGKAANLVRWGWSDYKLAGVPIMSHQAFLALGLLEHALAGMYPMQLWRASGEAVSYGHVHAVFRQMLRLGNIAPTGEKNPRGRPIYVITEAGRAALVTMRALIVEV